MPDPNPTGWPVDELWTDSVDVKSIDYDWSNGYPEVWDFVEAPTTGDGYAVWDEDDHCWRDGNGEEVEASAENGCEGPMMNYYYPLPDLHRFDDDVNKAASAIADLPLCIVTFQETGDHALALTGGGMDLSWEICEAFIRLGWLPPVQYCDLPDLAGRNWPGTVQACLRSCEVVSWRASRTASKLVGFTGETEEEDA